MNHSGLASKKQQELDWYGIGTLEHGDQEIQGLGFELESKS